MKIYERVYDEPFSPMGIKKDNKLLGYFELVEGNMDDYSYTCYLKDKKGEIYKLIGKEVSGFYNPLLGGTLHRIIKLSETEDVQAYLRLIKKV